jgi:hypothetical protein
LPLTHFLTALLNWMNHNTRIGFSDNPCYFVPSGFHSIENRYSAGPHARLPANQADVRPAR